MVKKNESYLHESKCACCAWRRNDWTPHLTAVMQRQGETRRDETTSAKELLIKTSYTPYWDWDNSVTRVGSVHISILQGSPGPGISKLNVSVKYCFSFNKVQFDIQMSIKMVRCCNIMERQLSSFPISVSNLGIRVNYICETPLSKATYILYN